MEEQIRNCLITIFEMTSECEELIIQKLSKLSFDEPLKTEQIIFLCSQVITSDINLFKYLNLKCGLMDRKHITFRRKVIEFLKEFIVHYASYCKDYLEHIKIICIALYRAEQSQVLKEKVLMLTAKILETYPLDLIQTIYQPEAYIRELLEDIKVNKLTSSIKGCIWNIIGILIGKFSILLSEYKIEVHDVIMSDFEKLLKQKKFEFKAVTGIMKSFMYLLDDPHLTAAQIKSLYVYLKSLMIPLTDANSIKINKLALDLLGTHGKIFTVQIKHDMIELFDSVFNLCNHKNYELKMAANEAIEKISMHISDCLLDNDNDNKKDCFDYLLRKIKNVLERESSGLLINTAISLIGIFSNAIVRFLPDKTLNKYLEELIVIYDKEICNTLGREAYRDAKNKTEPDNFKPSKSIKYILSIQKQYISLLNSYSNIIANLPSLSEFVVKHFYSVLMLGFTIHSRFYEKYKVRFTESIASIIVNMASHADFFRTFLRNVVKTGFIESIKMTQKMIFKENIEEVSITNSINFWLLLLTRDKTFTEWTLTILFNQLFTEINSLVTNLNISYVEKTNENNDVYYEANNVDDLEIFNRTCRFLSGFISTICNEKLYSHLQNLFNEWIIIQLKHFSKLANEYPRIAICYTVLSALMKLSQVVNYFGRNNKNTYEAFLSEYKAFNKSVIKRIEVFQDELLLNSIEFLLLIPTELIKEIYHDDIKTLKYLFIKSFEIGFNDIRYAKLALKALKRFFSNKYSLLSGVSSSKDIIGNKYNTSEDKKNKEILHEILPIFGQYLVEYEKIKESFDPLEIEKIEKYSKIQNKIFDILGSIGGEAHNIIPSTEEKKNNLLNIMNTKKLSYFFPLYNKKYFVYFDNLIIKISDIALNSVVKEKKFAACELLHSLILYLIGKQNEDLTNTLIFLIEKILFLACDLEKSISLIYEKLLFQIIHWMSKKGNLKDNKDVISMVDIIIDCSSSRKNLKLRELSSDCLREYIKWFIKQHTDYTIKEKSTTIKYLIRKIESNALHPDPFKRLGSSLCFEKILPILGSNEFLVDKFLLEITFYILSIMKICHNSTELNEFVFEHCLNSLDILFKCIKEKMILLSKFNNKRNIFKDLKELFDYFLTIMIGNETECSFVVNKLLINLFDLIGIEQLRSSSLSHYFTINKIWPVLSNSYTVGNYQYIYFLLSNNIINDLDLNKKYSHFSIPQLVKQLTMVMTDILHNEDIEKKIVFAYIVEIMRFNKNLTELIEEFINDSNDLFENMFSSIEKMTNKDIKYFIINKYDNILYVFINYVKELMEAIFKIKTPQLASRLKKYLNEQCCLFKDYSKEEELNEACSKNEKCNEFFFWLLSNEDSNRCSQDTIFIERLKNNFEFLLKNPQPKTQLLVKYYFCFLFQQDFLLITTLMTKSQYKFDFLADHFFNMIFNSNKDFINGKGLNLFLTECCRNNQQLVIIFILFERATLAKKRELTDIISQIFLKNIIPMDNIDAIVNQIKIATLILINIIDTSASSMEIDSGNNNNNPICNADIALMKLIEMYLPQKSINVIKEILNLLGLIVKSGNSNLQDKIKEKYRTIQSRYFPVNTKSLNPNSKEWTEFQMIFSCLLNTFNTVKTFEFLEILFPILREEKTEYSKQVKNSLKDYLDNIINTNDINEIQKAIKVFLDKSGDNNLRDNIRFTIMKIITFKFLKKCSSDNAAQLFILNYKQFEDMIKVNIDTLQSNEAKFLLILEKTIIFNFFQLTLEKIPTDVFRNDIHKKIYGQNCQGNEITKILIGELHLSKRNTIKNWENICDNIKFSEYNSRTSNKADTEMYVKQKENLYYCSAYNCLCVIIKSTQGDKENIFNNFLFTTMKGDSQLFDLLVSSFFVYNFAIETNFHIKKLQPKEFKGVDNNMKNNQSNRKLMIDEIITDSFFHDAYGASIKESLAFTQKTFSMDFLNKINTKAFQQQSNPNIEALLKSQPMTIEEDLVNKHPVMKNLLIILDHMNIKFTSNDSNKMPNHLQLLLNEIKRDNLSLNLKIFFIKLIINKREIFNPYMNHFYPFLIKFTIDKNSCGKGFNYFIRDIATCILSSDQLTIEPSKENIEMMSSYINTLIKICGDKKNIIFRTNLKIVNDLMEKFHNVIFLNKKTLITMIELDDKKQDSHIWKITAVQILASAMEYDVSIGDDDIYSYSNDKKNLFIKSIERNEKIVHLLIKLCENSRTPVQSASVEVLAKILLVYYKEDKRENNMLYMTIYEYLKMSTLNMKIAVNVIFRASMHFPQFVEQKEVFNKTLQLMKQSPQKQRNLIMRSLTSFITEIVNRLTQGKSQNPLNDKSYIDDCYYNLIQSIEVIFVDPNDELLLNCIGILTPMILMKEKKYSEGILRIVSKIQNDIRRKDTFTRESYFTFLFELFNQSYDEFLSRNILNVIVINFDCEQNKELFEKIYQFINKNSKIPPHPAERLIYLMTNLNKETIESEGKFIQFLIKMTMILIYTSGDYDLKIYDKGLEDCVYKDLNVNTSGYYLNRSQPIAPSIVIRNTMSEAYQTLLAVNQNEMTQAGMIKSSIAIDPNAMDIDKDNNNKDNNNNPIPSSLVSNSNNISMTQRDITLSQYSSLVNTTANYPSMKTANKSVNFGLTHGEVFKMPDPVIKKKRKGNYGSFISENEMTYSPIENTSNNNIRFVPEGANHQVKKQKELSEEILIYKWLNRENEVRKKQVKLMRQYRDGDLPDIQIKNKDILEPLLAVCNFNPDISSELFLELMVSIYKESIAENNSNIDLEQNIEKVLRENKLSNYLVVSCLHRLILSFMKENNNYIPQLSLIQRSGLYSKNYHSSILIFEEVISQRRNVNGDDDDNVGIKKKKLLVKSNYEQNDKCDISLNEDNKNAWTNLLQFYSNLKIEDSQIGLIQNFSYASNLYLRDSNDFLTTLSSYMMKSNMSISRNENKANLLHALFNIGTGTDNTSNADKFVSLKAKYHINLFKDDSLKEVIEDYAIASCGDLGKWDDLSLYLSHKLKNKPQDINGEIFNKEKLEKEKPDNIIALLKSWVFTSKQLPTLLDPSTIDNTHSNNNQNTIFKAFIENTCGYYLSLYYINQKNFDKAFLYYQKAKSNLFKTWLNLGAYCYDLKHEVIQSIQKIYEVGEFLSFIRGTSTSNVNLLLGKDTSLSEKGTSNIISLFNHWLDRWPNHLYDAPSAYNEIFTARSLINNTMIQKIDNYNQIIFLNPILDCFIPRSLIEIAKNLYKKNYLDFADINIKSALRIRKDNSYINNFIMYPVIKNKFKMYHIETSSSVISYDNIKNHYEKFNKILNHQMGLLDNNNQETKQKLLILQIRIFLNITEFSQSYDSEDFKLYYKKAQYHFENEEKKLTIENNRHYYLKLLRPMIKFCDGMIRNETLKIKDNKFEQLIYKQYLECGLKSLIMNDTKMSNIIPKILDLLSKHQNFLSDIFLTYSPEINIDYYIKWKNQLIAYINTPIANLLKPIIEKILGNDSQSLFFIFSTVEMYHEIFFANIQKRTSLFNYLKDFYSKYTALNGFTEALDGLTNPEHRFQFWAKQLETVLVAFHDEQNDKETTVNTIKNIIAALNYDLLNTNKKYIGKKVGSYNMKFSQDVTNTISSLFTLEKIRKLVDSVSFNKSSPGNLHAEYTKMIEPINIVINKRINTQFNEGIERLSTFSEWLSQYECNDFTKPESYIILPSSSKKKIMISSFDQHLIILPSIRRPKRILIYGNDEKSYSYLAKGGEDIRLDQRIEEVFKVCNDILYKDSNCTKKKIKLNIFDVIPISQKLGLIEWVNNTQPLLGVIKYSMENIFNHKHWDLKSSAPQLTRIKWYNDWIKNDKQLNNITTQHFIALHCDDPNKIANALQSHENLIPRTVLKRALEHYLLTPEEVLMSRIQFMRNYSALSIACYILGIGDRHLDNFLINIHTSEIVAIDFGVAFGQGILQYIPELVPFRMTSQIRSVIYPFGINGIIRQTMIDCLSAFKLSKDYILDYCEVFVKEPLLDWIKRSKSSLTDYVGNHTADMNLSWLPSKKLAIIENKLKGMNPIKIMLDEFLDSKIFKEKTQVVITEILYSKNPDSARMMNKNNDYLEVDTQIDCLNEQATDQNLLGRMWIGWSPFI